MPLWVAILFGSLIVTLAVVAVVVILTFRISTNLDKIIEKLERIEWATGELERRVPDWLSRR
jgi:hypothetical protein